MIVYVCTKFNENIIGGIKVVEQAQFSKEIFQRGISP